MRPLLPALLFSLCIVACTSTETRSGPGAALDVAGAVAGVASHGTGGLNLPADWKHQITISGRVITPVNCFININDLIINLTKPSPDSTTVCSANPAASGKYQIICATPAGKYDILLMNSRGGKQLAKAAIDSEQTDRFQIDLDACPTSK